MFRLVAALGVPLVLLSGLECGLRIFGYGYPTHFLLPAPRGGGYVPNWKFGWRFFPRDLSREPVLFRLDVPKPPGRYRIVVLGSSAAQGVPMPESGFPRILQVLLQERYPGTDFEVVNAAVTAVNSHVIRLIARDCLDAQPDLFVIYTGNNEVVGPYGPGTSFLNERSSRQAIRAGAWLKSTRIGQFLDHAAASAASGGKRAPGRATLEMFLDRRVPADDPRLGGVYENFRRNLTDTLETARSAGVGAVVATVAVNLKDFAPLASAHRAGLARADLETWERLVHQANADAQAGRHAQAVEAYEKALSVDERHAESHFRLARSLLVLGRGELARKHFGLARDLDELRVRADSRINEIIRQVAGDRRDRAVLLADVDKAFESDPGVRDGVPGGEMFHEHVHLTFAGNYAVARVVGQQVAALLPEPIRARDGGAGWIGQARCAELVPHGPREELLARMAMDKLMSGPPFTSQYDHPERAAARWRELEALRTAAKAGDSPARALERYERAVQASPHDLLLQSAHAGLLLELGRYDGALDRLRAIAPVFPEDVNVLAALGRAEAGLKRYGDAEAHFRKAIALKPRRAVTHFYLVDMLVRNGQAAAAVAHLRALAEQLPEDPEVRYRLANVLIGQDKLPAAIAELEAAIGVDPDYSEGQYALGLLRRATGQPGRAIEALLRAQQSPACQVQAAQALVLLFDAQGNQTAVEGQCRLLLTVSPSDPHARVRLAAALFGQGRHADALAEARRALAEHPDSSAAARVLAWQLATCPEAALRDGRQAVDLAQRACRQTENRNPLCLDTLGAACAEAGRFPEAIQAAEGALGVLQAGPEVSADEIRARLAGYRAGRPFRQPAPASRPGP